MWSVTWLNSSISRAHREQHIRAYKRVHARHPVAARSKSTHIAPRVRSVKKDSHQLLSNAISGDASPSPRNQTLKTTHSSPCPLPFAPCPFPIPFPDCQLHLHEFNNHWSILRFLCCGKQEQRPLLLGFALLAAKVFGNSICLHQLSLDSGH
ncbi:hypothetical protein VNO78_15489 [Psophocarpus tetragonolobus]|uniref:Uncharacterized protein n=1 Tax=Psophocarpus tetragonolobus TaxID=3891 RepID=A0AAN9XJY8_PSOTE